jgi:hypothetical protein
VSVAVGSVATEPPRVGPVLLVTAGRVVRFDTGTRRAVPMPLPRGVLALRAWSVRGTPVVLGRQLTFPPGTLPGEDRAAAAVPHPDLTAAYLARPGRQAIRLGTADQVVPAADGRAVWLAAGGHATRVALAGRQPPVVVPLPPAARLIADTPAGLVTTTGSTATPGPTPQPKPTTPSPSPSPNGTSPNGPPPTAPSVAGPPRTGSSPNGASPAGPSPTTQAEARARAVGPPADRAGATATSTTGYAGGQGGGSVDGEAAADPDAGRAADVVPVTTLLVQRNGLTRFLADAEALAGVGDVVLVRRADLRLGVVSLSSGRGVRWLPLLSAVEATGPAALDFHGRTFAVLARVHDHARLMVGPTTADSEADINVVALEGGIPPSDPVPPAFTVGGWVLAARPDGKVVYYYAGERTGLLLGDDLPPATAAVQN